MPTFQEIGASFLQGLQRGQDKREARDIRAEDITRENQLRADQLKSKIASFVIEYGKDYTEDSLKLFIGEISSNPSEQGLLQASQYLKRKDPYLEQQAQQTGAMGRIFSQLPVTTGQPIPTGQPIRSALDPLPMSTQEQAVASQPPLTEGDFVQQLYSLSQDEFDQLRISSLNDPFATEMLDKVAEFRKDDAKPPIYVRAIDPSDGAVWTYNKYNPNEKILVLSGTETNRRKREYDLLLTQDKYQDTFDKLSEVDKERISLNGTRIKSKYSVIEDYRGKIADLSEKLSNSYLLGDEEKRSLQTEIGTLKAALEAEESEIQELMDEQDEIVGDKSPAKKEKSKEEVSDDDLESLINELE